MKTLSKNKDLLIQKSDKGNSVVLIDNSDYLDKMCNILSDSKKFVQSSKVDDEQLTEKSVNLTVLGNFVNKP